MATYNIEVTDTFGGDANYCWVRRYAVTAKSMLGAVQKLASIEGSGWKVDYNDGNFARYNLKGACVCAFIEECWDND